MFETACATWGKNSKRARAVAAGTFLLVAWVKGRRRDVLCDGGVMAAAF